MQQNSPHSSNTHWLQRVSSRHGIRITALFVALTLLFTFPTLTQLYQSSWLADAEADGDAFFFVWNAWHFQQVLDGETTFDYTDAMFYPAGVDLTFQSYNLLQMVMIRLFAPLLGAVSAFNLTGILFILFSAGCGYLYLQNLLDDKLLAFYGACIFGFSPWVIGNIRHPDSAFLAFIPLCLMFYHIALTRYKPWAILAAAITFGVNAYLGLYTFVVLALYLVILFPYYALAESRWKEIQFWAASIGVAGGAFIVAAPRLLPMIADRGALQFALEDKYDNYSPNRSVDLFNFLFPTEHPLFVRVSRRFFPRFIQSYAFVHYLGLVPLVLSLYALVRKRYRRQVIGWFGMVIFFAVLSMGPFLHINGQAFRDVLLPKFYLDQLLPLVFQSFGLTLYFHLGVLLPLAIAAAYGLKLLLEDLQNRQRLRNGIVLLIIGGTLFEYWVGPIKGRDMAQRTDPFYETLREETDDFAIIQMPLETRLSKFYLYWQTVHEKPIVEGFVSRPPATARDYISNNLLLTTWGVEQEPLDCDSLTTEQIQSAVDQWQDDNFRYLIFHGAPSDDLAHLTPHYASDSIAVYRVEDVQAQPPCADVTLTAD